MHLFEEIGLRSSKKKPDLIFKTCQDDYKVPISLFVEPGSLDTFYPVGAKSRLYQAFYQARMNLNFQVIIKS